MNARSRKMTIGIASIVTASLLWSVNYLILKSVSGDLGPITITFLEAMSGVVTASLVFRISPRMAAKALRRGGKPAVLMGFLGVTVATSIFIFSLRHLDLGVASILEKTQPIFTVVLAAVFLKERLTPLSICFGLLGLIGSVIVVPFSETTHSLVPKLSWTTALGVIGVLLAAFTWAAAGVLGRKLAVDDLGPANMSLLRAMVGAATALPLCLLFETPHFPMNVSWHKLGLIFAGGAMDSCLCYVFYYHGMKYVAAGITSIIEIITPVGAVILGVCMLGEHIALHQYLGAFIVLAAVTALVFNELREHAKSASSLEKHS
jgi:drug/metabolite transporter (DMT)-like permease